MEEILAFIGLMVQVLAPIVLVAALVALGVWLWRQRSR